MNEAEIWQYLEDNPDFFQKHPDLLAKLELSRHAAGLPSLPLLRLQQLRSRLADCQQALHDERQQQELHQRRCRAMQQLAMEFLYIQSIEELAESIDHVCSDEMSVSKVLLRFWQAAPGIPMPYLLPKISQSPLLQRLDHDGFFWGLPPPAEKKLLLASQAAIEQVVVGQDFPAFVFAGLSDAQYQSIGLLIFVGRDEKRLYQELDRPFLRFCRDLIRQTLIKCLHFNDLNTNSNHSS